MDIIVGIGVAIGVAIVGAFAGALANERLRRPRPRLIPTSIRLTTDRIPAGSVVAPNSELLAEAAESPYLTLPSYGGRVDERRYVGDLMDALVEAREIVRVRLPAIVGVAQQLQNKLGADDFDGFKRLWAREFAVLWVAIEGAYVREEFELPPDPTYEESDRGAEFVKAIEGEQARLRVEEDEDGDILLIMPPTQVIVLQSRSGIGAQRSRELARRVGRALAYWKTQDLSVVLSHAATLGRQGVPLEHLIQQITEELERLKRLSVTALLSNGGGTPLSVSRQRCNLELFLEGYGYSPQGDGAVKPFLQRAQKTLELLLVDDEGEPIRPITIGPGAVRPITAIYDASLHSELLPEGGSLYDLVHSALGSERKWKLRLPVILQNDPGATVHSSKIAFSDIGDVDVPRSPESGSGGRQALAAAETQLAEAQAEAVVARREASATRAELRVLSAELHGPERGLAQPRATGELAAGPQIEAQEHDRAAPEIQSSPGTNEPL
jgi:hypothetical protein